MSSLADLAARRIKTHARVATLDIERIPGRFATTWRGMTVKGDFWDLSETRRTIGRRLDPDDVTEWPRTICVAWRWQGQKRVNFASEWGQGRDEMLRRVWDVYNKAEMIVGHNVDSFDTKTLKGEWAMMGLTPPSPWKTYDTLKVARRELRLESNKLDSLCQRFGLNAKTDRYSVEMARAAVAGDKAAQRQIRAYNEGDIQASEDLADFLRPWHRSHPIVGNPADERVCTRCGSTDLTLSDKRYRAVVLDYGMLLCSDCGAWMRAGHVARAATTRGVA